jgi:hypothetical protein
MKLDRAKAPKPSDGLHPELDSENGEFDFSAAPRPGRNTRYEVAQGHFYEVTDADDLLVTPAPDRPVEVDIDRGDD